MVPIQCKNEIFLIRSFEERDSNNEGYLSTVTDSATALSIGRPEYSVSPAVEQIREHNQSLLRDPNIGFYILESESGEFVGTAKLSFSGFRPPAVRSVDIGIMIQGNMRKHGIGFSVFSWLSSLAFIHSDVQKLTGGTMSSNFSMIKIFERCGFRLEGVLRRKFYYDFTYFDHNLYGCFIDELGVLVDCQREIGIEAANLVPDSYRGNSR